MPPPLLLALLYFAYSGKMLFASQLAVATVSREPLFLILRLVKMVSWFPLPAERRSWELHELQAMLGVVFLDRGQQP